MWQQKVFAEHPDFEEEPVPEGQYAPYPRYRLRPGADPATLRFDRLGYADVAIGSYERFAALKRDGAIPAHMRFQISLPTPLSPLNNFVALHERAIVEPAYEAAMLREVDEIVEAIPHGEIAIQWDIAFEMGFAEGVPHPMFTPWFDDVLGGSAERIARAIGARARRRGARPSPLLRRLRPRALPAADRRPQARRDGERHPRRHVAPIAWMHLPVPRDRTDAAYYAPLRELRLHPETELYLGLVHLTDGEEGTRARIAAAQEVVSAFGVATECGFGRRDPSTVAPLLDLHAAVADPVV